MNNVFEINCRVYNKKAINYKRAITIVREFIDISFTVSEEFREFHEKNLKKNKGYSFGCLYPVKKEGYEEDSIYSFTLRTNDVKLVEHFRKTLNKVETENLKGLKAEVKKLNTKKIIKEIYTYSPAVIRAGEAHYWKDKYESDYFESRLVNNTNKKLNIDGEKTFVKFYSHIEIRNTKPVPITVKVIGGKEIKMLGDHLNLEIENDSFSQKLAWSIIATGLMELSTRGCGFVGYKCY